MTKLNIAWLKRLENSDGINNNIIIQLVKYGIIGVTVNGLGYGMFLLITHLGTPPKIAMTILYTAAVAFGYIGHREWTFEHSGSHLKTSLRYFFVHGTGYLINLSLLYICVDNLGYSYQLVQLAAIFVVALYLFAAFKIFVFKA